MERLITIGLGSNLGNRVFHLSEALKRLGQNLELTSSSSIYQSDAQGFNSSLKFLNLVAIFKSEISTRDLFKLIKEIEDDHGRTRSSQSPEDRTIDLDILFIDDEIIEEEEIIIPHPKLHQRNFVLAPLVEINTNFVHPKFQKTIIDLYAHCIDDNLVSPYLP